MNSKELERYKRQLSLKEVGLDGQSKLANSKVLVVGAGGLGCPVLLYLAASGVGKIGILESDIVEESNLQRQVLFDTNDLGASKADVAEEKLKLLNPLIQVQAYYERLSPENALERIADYDIVVDATDNFASRYLINDAAVILGKPWVYGAVDRFEGQVTLFNHQNGPTYRCLFPESESNKNLANCEEAGVLGVLPGIIGQMMAVEVLKFLLDIGELLSGRLLMYKALSSKTEQIEFTPVQAQIDLALSKSVDFKNLEYELRCSAPLGIVRSIEARDLSKHLVSNPSAQLLDVREMHENGEFPYPNQRIPMSQIPKRVKELNPSEAVIVSCHAGTRSKIVAAQLMTQYGFDQVYNLKGGLKALMKEEKAFAK